MKKCVLFIVIFIFSARSINAQCSADAGPDKFICTTGGNTSTTIGPANSTGGYTYSWYPTTGLSNPNTYNPTASPISNTTYYLTMLSTTNLLSNSGFESGFSGFTTDFGACESLNAGNACIEASVISSCTANPHDGNYFYHGISHNSDPADYRLWSETINVSTGVYYQFSGFMSTFTSGNAASFEVRLIGNNTGTETASFTPTTYCSWQNFSYGWASTTNSQVTIEIRLTNAGAKALLLDDLYFGTACMDDVNVRVATSAPSITPVGPITYYYWYEGTEVIELTSNKAGQWYKNSVAISGATGATYNYPITGSGTSTDTLKCVNGCGASNQVVITRIGCTARNQYPVTIPPGNIDQYTELPYAVTQPNAGGLGTHSWALASYDPWFVSPVNTRNAELTMYDVCADICTGYAYSKAKTVFGVETRMAFGFQVCDYCRMSGGVFNPEPKDPFGSSASMPAAIPLKAPVTKPSIITQTRLQPNPASAEVTVMSKHIMHRIDIYNAMGVLVKNIPINKANKMVISTDDLNTGYYSLRLATDKGVESLKLVIQR